MPSLELACFNVDSALVAASAGADRIELCADASVGGVTPNFDEFVALKKRAKLPVNVMIRPRGGDFIYSVEEFEAMQQDLVRFREAGADGFVFGVLNEGGNVDVHRNQKMVKLANGRECTFHRAFDDIVARGAWVQALQDLIECGFASVLTSGGAHTAMEGRGTLHSVVQAAGEKVDIIVGGGVRSHNARSLREIGAKWFHSSALIGGKDIASEQEVRSLRMALES